MIPVVELIELNVGDKVAVAHCNYRSMSGHVSSQGVYEVIKVNKVRIVLRRKDGYERTFSTRTGKEKSQWSDRDDNFIETVEDMQERQARVDHESAIRSLWVDLRVAAERKNLDEVKKLVADLEAKIS